MILTGRSLAETNTTDSIGGIYGGVDSQARRGDAPFRLEFAFGCGQVLLSLGQIAACLGSAHVPDPRLSSHRGPPQVR